MCDAYIYYFIASNGPHADILSARPATLEAIKSRGVPVMATQLVVDHSELDGAGFLVANLGDDSYAIRGISAEIVSLEARAASRDKEVIASADGIHQYMLSLESKELRKQARILRSRRSDSTTGESSIRPDSRDFINFGAGLATW